MLPVLINKSGSGIFFVCKFLFIFFSLILHLVVLIFLKAPTNSVLEPVFKNATFWSNSKHWEWANYPNYREKASFLQNNILPIKESGQLKFVKRDDLITSTLLPKIDVFFADGHTESQMIPIINYKGQKIVFMADLLPSIGHIPLPYVMGYDTRPLQTLAEKSYFLESNQPKKNNII